MKTTLCIGLLLAGLLWAPKLLGVEQAFIKSQFAGKITVTTTRCGFIVDAPIESGYTHRAEGCKAPVSDYLEEIIVYNRDGQQISRMYVTDKKLAGDVFISINTTGQIDKVSDLKDNPQGKRVKDSGKQNKNWQALNQEQKELLSRLIHN
jgi:hypothetical protein